MNVTMISLRKLLQQYIASFVTTPQTPYLHKLAYGYSRITAYSARGIKILWNFIRGKKIIDFSIHSDSSCLYHLDRDE